MNHDRRGRPAAKALIRGRDTVLGTHRLCRQPVTTIDHIVDGTTAGAGRAGRRNDAGHPQPVDRVRVVRLRAPQHQDAPQMGPAGEAARYHHRWPVRMHKVRQYYPSRDAHQIIWRGPYIKGPEGTPLLAGGKALVLR